MTKQHGAPPSPSRVRLVRPQFYRSESTGALPPDVRDLLVGLTTIADDEGWLLWSPSEIAATLYTYQSAGRRVRDLERRTTQLVEAGLLDVKACGCAFLPTLQAHHAVKGGDKSRSVWEWHQRHPSVALRSATEESVPVSGSVTASASSSGNDLGSASSRASDTPKEETTKEEATCLDCRRPTSVHAASCPSRQHPHLQKVSA